MLSGFSRSEQPHIAGCFLGKLMTPLAFCLPKQHVMFHLGKQKKEEGL